MFLLFQVYYYNARTRESSWTKPESVKIMTQGEIEAMAAAQQQQQQQQHSPTSQSGSTTTAAQAAIAQGIYSYFSGHWRYDQIKLPKGL